MSENLYEKYGNGSIVIATLPKTQFPKKLCNGYYIINREDTEDKSIWTCMCKDVCHRKAERDFDAFFNEMSSDGVCMVIPWEKEMDIKKLGGKAYYYFAFGRMATQYWLVVRKSKLPQNGDIAFKVPDYLSGRIIGGGGKNVQYIAKVLKRRIHIVACKRHVICK